MIEYTGMDRNRIFLFGLAKGDHTDRVLTLLLHQTRETFDDLGAQGLGRRRADSRTLDHLGWYREELTREGSDPVRVYV